MHSKQRQGTVLGTGEVCVEVLWPPSHFRALGPAEMPISILFPLSAESIKNVSLSPNCSSVLLI